MEKQKETKRQERKACIYTVWQGGHTTSLICAIADVTSAIPTSNNSINSNSVRDNASCELKTNKQINK